MTTIIDRCTSACLKGPCDCGAIVNDVLQRSFHIPLMLKDGSSPTQPERKTLAMLTDAEKRTMRDSVKTMALADAAKLAIYDDVRGTFVRGIPAAEYFAASDGAIAARPTSDDQHRAQAYRDHAAEQTAKAWRAPTNDNRAEGPQFARDGRPMSALDPRERIQEQRIIQQTNAWKR